MGTTFEKLTPRIIQFRDYKQFYNNKFRQKLLPELSLQNLRTNCNGLEKGQVWIWTGLLQEKRNADK